MCIECLSSEKSKKRFLKEAKKRGYIRVWKVCRKGKTGWMFRTRYKPGLCKAFLKRLYGYSKRQKLANPDFGWHVYLSLQRAEKDCTQCNESIKVCYAKPSWLKGLSLETKCATFTHLVFPEWDKGNMTIREFRQVCKEQK